MVAITVILAAVIGTFVLGLGDSLQDTSPQASFGFDYGENWDADPAVTISHEGGDSIDRAALDVTVDGTNVTTSWSGSGDIGAGSTFAFNSTNVTGVSGAFGGETIRVVWESDDGSSSQTIGTSTAPSN